MREHLQRIFLLFLSVLHHFSSTQLQAEEPLSHPIFRPTLGVLTALTGNFAVMGRENRCGTEAALKYTSFPIPVVYGDTRGESAPAVSEYKTMLQRSSDLVLFVQRSTSGMAINALSARDRIPLLGGVGHPKFASSNPYAWQFWVSSDEEGMALAEAAIANNSRKIAIITVEDEWSVTVSNGFRNSFTKRNGSILFDESVLPTDTDLKPLLLKVARSGANGLFLNASIGQLGAAIRQARELNLNYPIYSTFWCATPDVIAVAGSASDGVIFVEMKTDYPTFRADVRSCAGDTPSSVALGSYASTLLLLQTMANNPHIASLNSFYDALMKENKINLPDVTLEIKDRRVKFPLVVKTIRGGRAEIIK